MSTLVDALKKAGLGDEKKRKKAERELRSREHQKKKKKKKKKKKNADNPVQLTQAEKQAQAQSLIREKLAGAVTEGMISSPGGRRRFFFEARSGRIPFLSVSDLVQLQLQSGKVAIVEDPNSTGEHLIVSRDAAIRMTDIDQESVRFFRNA